MPSRRDRELHDQICNWPEREVEFLLDGEIGRNADDMRDFVVFNKSVHVDWWTDFWDDIAVQKLKHGPVNGMEDNLPLVGEGVAVHARVKHSVGHSDLLVHAQWRLSLGGSSAKSTLDIVDHQPAFWIPGQESLNEDVVLRLPVQHCSVAVHEDVGLVLNVNEHLVHSVSSAELSGDWKLPNGLLHTFNKAL